MTILITTTGGGLGCTGSDPSPGKEIRPGEGIGQAEIGLRYAELKARLGEPDAVMVNNRNGLARYDGLGLETVFVSSQDSSLSDDAVLVAVGARIGGRYRGAVVPGSTRAEVEAAFGAPAEVVGNHAYYAAGAAVVYDGDVARLVAVFPAYDPQPDPPPMESAPQP